jgi:hypothetical protein
MIRVVNAAFVAKMRSIDPEQANPLPDAIPLIATPLNPLLTIQAANSA